MAVLVIAEVKGQTQQGYEAVRAALADVMKSAPGFILHAGHATPDGWRIVEVWQTKEDSDRFYAKFVAPNLPSGIHPKRRVRELHGLLKV
jgi:hypothetical protein